MAPTMLPSLPMSAYWSSFLASGTPFQAAQKWSPSKITSSLVLNEGVAVIFLAGFSAGRWVPLQLRSPPPQGSTVLADAIAADRGADLGAARVFTRLA